MPPVMRLPRLCVHAIPTEACCDCRHECNPPALQVMFGRDMVMETHSAGDRWRCSTCRRRWTVIHPPPIQTTVKPWLYPNPTPIQTCPGLAWLHRPTWFARLVAWLD